MLYVPMPMPNPRIDTLAARLHHYAIAIHTLAAVQEAHKYPPGEELPGDVQKMFKQLEMLRDDYLAMREEFTKLRAEHEHLFMTWHTALTDHADARFTQAGGAPSQKPWGGKVPEWADEENNLTALLEKAAEKAAAHNEGV